MVVLFDFDEVFVDLNTGALKYINEKLKTEYTLKDLNSWEFYDNPTIRPHFFDFLSLPDLYQKHVIPNKKMINVLKQMVEMNKEVYIVTASVESSEKSKYQFIVDKLPFFNTKNLFTVNNSSKYKNKSDVLDELNLNYHEPIVLIDDGIHNILDMMADIKHKDKLDDLMKQFYVNRTLKKYNNPYHDFIYGIVPELEYNKNIEEGKRIYKLKETKDIWGILSKINDQHKVRVENKQNEMFNYLNNIIDNLIEPKYFKEVNELQNNVSFMTKTLLNKHNKHYSFLSDIAKFSVKVEKLIEESNYLLNINEQDSQKKNNLNKIIIENIFNSADKKFGSDVMYNEIKNLSILHIANDILPENASIGKKISENYDVNEKQLDFFATTTLKRIIDISKDNINASKNIIKKIEFPEAKENIKFLLKTAGMAHEFDFEDNISLFANITMAFNKNYNFNEETNTLNIKNKEVEEFKQKYIKYDIIDKSNINKQKIKVS